MSGAERLRAGYHDLLRPEILKLVPSGATSILDLGCGAGALGKALKQRQKCLCRGIELNKEAGETAKEHLDAVWIDNLNRFDPAFLKLQYDTLICADILEHLVAPWQVLKKFTAALKPGGVVVASVPNIAHPWIVSQLQKGLFRYELSGLLDITHLRFFTKTTIGQLFYKAGLKITSIKPHPAENNPIQYLVTAKKPLDEQKDPLATILILTLNAWEYTALCLESIKRNTEIPHKILVIDNGSTDGTVEKLRQDDTIYHIENSCNLGFARGYNIGLELVDTPFFVISNNDVIVTRHWLGRMIKNIERDPAIVGSGPRSNYVSGPQVVKDVPYKNEDELQTYTKSFGHLCKQPLTEYHRLVFFFVLFKSGILSKVGLLDERFATGNFEDDDFCMRVAIKKFKLVIDNTVFIHHYGSQTFKHNKIDYAKTMEENKKRFMDKWQLTCGSCN